MRIGSLFSGAGGLDLAVEAVFGGETVWHSELDPAASAVLAYRWPGVPNLGDITQVDWAAVEPVDVLCGGFPCQDVSAAGKRAGIKAGTRSGLWAMFADAIDQLRPRFVVIENVRGLLSADGEPYPPIVVAAHAEWKKWWRVEDLIARKLNRAQRKGNFDNEYIRRKRYEAARVARLRERALARFRSLRTRFVQRAIGTVIADLSSLGYDTQWTTHAAADIGAPHRRERVFILATATDATKPERRRAEQQHLRASAGSAAEHRERPGAHSLGCGDAAHTPRDGRHQGRPESARLVGGFDAPVGGHGAVDLLPTPVARDHKGHNQRGDTTCLTGALLPTPNASDATGGGQHPDKREGHSRQRIDYVLLCTPSVADGEGGHATRSGDHENELLLPGQAREMATAWGKYEPAIRRWEQITRPAPAPTEPNRNGNPRLASRFSEWMQGWPLGWVTDPAIEISRNDELRIIGNGVVPQQARAALRYLLAVSEVTT